MHFNVFLFYAIFINIISKSESELERINQFLLNILQHPELLLCSLTILHTSSSDTIQINYQDLSDSHNPMISMNLSKNQSLIKFYVKHKSYCTIVLTIFNLLEDTKDVSDRVYSFIKGQKSSIKKDEDYFIFLSQNETLLDRILKSAPLGSKTKHRIGIYTTNMLLKGACFYCGIDGSSKVFSLLHPNLGTPASEELIRNQMNNLQGKSLRISTPLSTRWLNEMFQTEEGEWLPRRGPYMLVLDLLKKQMNFTVQHFPSTFGGTGAIINGTWVGTVGDVLYGRAELGHVTAETSSRHAVVAHSFPISYEWLTFSTGVPQPYFSWRAIYRPLSQEVWPLVGLSIIVAIVVFYIFMKISLPPNSPCFSLIVEYIFGTLLEQDSPSPDREIKIRQGKDPSGAILIFTIFWLMYTLVIATAYRSKLVTFLAFPNVEEPPDSFEGLAEDGHYKIGLQYIKGAAYQVFKRSKNPTYMKIFKRMSLEESDVTCFEKAIGQRFACISWDSIAEFVKHRNLTDKFGRSPILKSPSSTLSISAGIVMEKRAVFRNDIDNILRWITDTGVLRHIREIDFRWIRHKRMEWLRSTNQTRKSYDATKSVDVLTLHHFSGSFYIFIIGIIISTFTIAAEFISRIKRFKASPVEQINLISFAVFSQSTKA